MLHVSDLLLTTGTMAESSDNSSALFMAGAGASGATSTALPKPNCCSCRKAVLTIISLTLLTATVGALFYYYQPWINPFHEIIPPQNISEKYEIATETFLLPRHVQPLRYRLKLHPNLDNFVFTGNVSIRLQCIQPTNSIQFHSELLNLTKILLTTSDNNVTVSDGGHVSQITKIVIKNVVYGKSKVTIFLETELEVDRNYDLGVAFSGMIRNDLVGLYRSSYSDDGDERWIATTHFQPNYARRMFPCFDEPRFKTTFEVSVARRTNMTVLSNMPSKEVEPLKNTAGWVWEHFMVSPLMSTYLVAITVSDFKSLNATEIGPGPVIKIWAPNNLLQQLQYAAEITPKIINFFEKYFQTKFSLLKLDLVAIPDFAMAAMENWGLISFRDASLLLDNETDTIEARRRIFNSVAHEIAHQWFGNLVSMDWWSELWLNEGFATYMAHLAESQLNGWESNFFEVLHNALALDAGKASHSMHIAVTNNMDTKAIFDPVIYDKAACLMRMLSSTVGEENFKQGIKDYIKTGSYNTTTEEKLWHSMEKFSNLSVFQFMSSWTSQPGYPLITVNRNYDTATLHITQSKFASNSTSNWIVPITYTSKTSSYESKLFFGTKLLNIKILAPRSDWIIFNLKQTGFYRVNYDLDNWNKLIDNYKFIPIWSKGQMINDAFELANYGYLSHEVIFKILKTMSFHERHYAPFKIALNGLRYLESIFMDTQYFGKYRNFVITFAVSNYNKNENFEVTPLEGIILESLCAMQYQPCIKTANKIYEKIYNGIFETKLSYILHQTVYCTAVAAGSDEVWDHLWNQTLITTGMELRNLYLALGCSKELWKIHSYIDKTISGEIEPQDVKYVWRSLSRNPAGRLIAFSYLIENWNTIYKVYKRKFMLNSIVEEFVQHLSTEADHQKVLNLYLQNKAELQPFSEYFESAIDAIKMKIDWKEKYLQHVLTLM